MGMTRTMGPALAGLLLLGTVLAGCAAPERHDDAAAPERHDNAAAQTRAPGTFSARIGGDFNASLGYGSRAR